MQNLKTPGNRSTSPVPSSSSTNPLDFVSHRVAMSEERQKKGWNLKIKIESATRRTQSEGSCQSRN